MAGREISNKPLKTCERARYAPPPPFYHRLRKRAHLVCFALFVLFPFVDVLRFDIPRQRAYIAGQELWISEFAILFFSLMFLMFLLAAASIFYGRVYCGYLCPQMIFSEASLAVEARLGRFINKRFYHLPAARRLAVKRALFLAVLAAASVFLAFIFIAYFVEPRDLFRRLMSFDIRTAGGIAGATVTLITFLDFTLVRQRFCTTACPYGYLQGILGDGNTLLVQYRDENRECIECKKCVRVCEMGIDIRTSPFQIECTHCGDCIDACADVLGRLGKAGLIHYAWGESGDLLSRKSAPWYRRIGLRDAKRVVVLLVALFYLCGLALALSLRKPVLVQVSPDRAKLYEIAGNGRIMNRFRARIANRSRKPARVTFAAAGLPGAQLSASEIDVPPGETGNRSFEITLSRFAGAAEVNHFRIVVRVAPDQGEEAIPMTFLMPPEGRGK